MTTSTYETALVHVYSPDESLCATVNLAEGWARSVGGEGQWGGPTVEVYLSDEMDGGYCGAPDYLESTTPEADTYRIHALTAAFVVASVQVAGHDVDLDISWVATGEAVPAKEGEDLHPDWSWVGKDAPAHLTGTILVDGVEWEAQQNTAILRSIKISLDY